MYIAKNCIVVPFFVFPLDIYIISYRSYIVSIVFISTHSEHKKTPYPFGVERLFYFKSGNL